MSDQGCGEHGWASLPTDNYASASPSKDGPAVPVGGVGPIKALIAVVLALVVICAAGTCSIAGLLLFTDWLGQT